MFLYRKLGKQEKQFEKAITDEIALLREGGNSEAFKILSGELPFFSLFFLFQ